MIDHPFKEAAKIAVQDAFRDLLRELIEEVRAALPGLLDATSGYRVDILLPPVTVTFQGPLSLVLTRRSSDTPLSVTIDSPTAS